MVRGPAAGVRPRVRPLLATALLLLLGTAKPATAADAGERSWLRPWREATVALGCVSQDTTGRSYFDVLGTGVIFAAPGDESGTPWLVTAKHVFSGGKGSRKALQLRFVWHETRSVYDEHGVTIALYDGDSPLWVAHPEARVDLAALPLKIRSGVAGRETVAGITLDNCASAGDLFEGASVFVLGYPGAVGRSFWTRALLRSGIISWIDPVKPLDTVLLIDSMVFPGNSGGPVFVLLNGVDYHGRFRDRQSVRFLGIVSEGRVEARPININGQPVVVNTPEGPVKIESQDFMGIGVIEPVSRVLELLAVARGLSAPPAPPAPVPGQEKALHPSPPPSAPPAPRGSTVPCEAPKSVDPVMPEDSVEMERWP
ncbi:MAG: serine protease [Pseudomonadota bacterium]